MLKCNYCNEEINVEAKFCPNCGSKLGEKKNVVIQDFDDESPSKESFKGNANESFDSTSETTNNKNPSKKPKILIPILLILGAIALFFIYKSFIKDPVTPFVATLNMSEVIHEPKYVGNDGQGKIDMDTLYIDKELLDKKLKEILGEDKPFNSNEIVSDTSFSIEPQKELSNGQDITINTSIANKDNYQEKYGIRFTDFQKTSKVTGLNKITDYDPFEKLTMEFSDFSPRFTLVPRNKELKDGADIKLLSRLSGLPYELYLDGKKVKADTFFKVGDEITIKLTQEFVDALLDSAMKPTREEMKYTVTEADGPSYITSKEELDKQFFDSVKTQAFSLVKSYLASQTNPRTPEFVGYYFLNPKEHVWKDSRSNNIPIMYLVYSYEYEDKYPAEGESPIKTKYTLLRVTNFYNEQAEIIEGANEEAKDQNAEKKFEKPAQYTDLNKIERPRYSYDSLDELYLNQIETKMSEYDIDMTERLKN